MSTAPIDYDALAKQAGALSSQSGGAAPIDYDALAKQSGAISSQASAPEAPEDNKPGFLSELYGNTVKPIVDVYHDYAKHTGENSAKYGVLSGFPAALQTVGDVSGGISDSFMNAAGKTIDAAKRRDFGRAIQQAPGVVPFVGPAVVRVGEQVESGNYPAALGGVTGLAASLAAPKIPALAGKAATAVKAFSPMESLSGLNRMAPEQLVTRGLRGSVPQGRTNFYQNLSTSMPAIKAVEGAYGKPIESLDDLVGTPQKPGAIQMAKRANRAEFDQLLGPHQAMGTQINLSPVADAIESSISDKTKLENPGEAQRIQAIADKYRKPFPVDTVDSLLRSTNAELNGYYAKNPAARRVASAANPDTALLDAQGQALRKAFYDYLDAPQQGAAARQLQHEYGTLSELEDAMQKRKNVALRQAPDSLSEQLAKWSSMGDILGGGAKMLVHPVAGVADIMTGLAKAKVAKWIREQQATDSLIKRAFANHTTPRISVNFPPPVQPAGLLGPGPIITPPPIDTSGNIPGAGPRYGAGLSPNIGNRQLPAGRNIITTPPPPDASGALPFEPQRNPGYWNPELAPRQKTLGPAEMHPIQSDLGSSAGDAAADRLVPVVHPRTGQVAHVPEWALKGDKPPIIVRSKSNPSVRMVLKEGQWQPLP